MLDSNPQALFACVAEQLNRRCVLTRAWEKRLEPGGVGSDGHDGLGRYSRPPRRQQAIESRQATRGEACRHHDRSLRRLGQHQRCLGSSATFGQRLDDLLTCSATIHSKQKAAYGPDCVGMREPASLKAVLHEIRTISCLIEHLEYAFPLGALLLNRK
jgi:hypothetical protein